MIWNESSLTVGISHRTDVQPLNLCFISKCLNFQDCLSLLSWRVAGARGAIPNQRSSRQRCRCARARRLLQPPLRVCCVDAKPALPSVASSLNKAPARRQVLTSTKSVHALIFARTLSDGEEDKGNTCLKCALGEAVLGPNSAVGFFSLCLPLVSLLPERKLRWMD